jgi:hypothetical protein
MCPASAGTGDPDPGVLASHRMRAPKARGPPEGTARARLAVHRWRGGSKIRSGGAPYVRAPRRQCVFPFCTELPADFRGLMNAGGEDLGYFAPRTSAAACRGACLARMGVTRVRSSSPRIRVSVSGKSGSTVPQRPPHFPAKCPAREGAHSLSRAAKPPGRGSPQKNAEENVPVSRRCNSPAPAGGGGEDV